ncbi:hypothetical protein [Escherichia coli]|uniref:hypothetical protein n=1 Tax=Escherichia coli TaxID=562 RepID=UPI000C14EBD2|nr:hypothetical protein [Escherichia coli]
MSKSGAEKIQFILNNHQGNRIQQCTCTVSYKALSIFLRHHILCPGKTMSKPDDCDGSEDITLTGGAENESVWILEIIVRFMHKT